MHWKGQKCLQKFCKKKLKRRSHLKNLGLEGIIRQPYLKMVVFLKSMGWVHLSQGRE